jgi:O-antigen/teichoic acid export membrane protein
MSSSVAKNALFMTAASVGQKIISFAYFTIVARSIGVSGTGKYFFALSFTTMFVVLVDMGLTNVFVREAARQKERTEDYLGSVLCIKLFTGVLAYAAMAGAIIALGYPAETRHLVYLSGITMLLDSLHLTLYGALRALGNLAYEAVSIIGSQCITLALGTFFLHLHLPIIFLLLAFTVSSFFNVCFIASVLVFRHRIRILPVYRRGSLAPLIRMAAPFALAAVFARVYSYSDSLLLSRIAGDEAVGWYSIPYKITYAFQFVPLALIAAVYPRFSEQYAANRNELARLLEWCIKYLLIVVAPIAVGIFLLAETIVLTVYTPEYLPSVRPLRILIISLIFSYMSFPVGAFLNACDRQKIQTAIVGIVMALNIILNLALIPRLGVAGAAFSACAGNVLLTVIGALFIPRIAAMDVRSLAASVAQIALSATVMGTIVWFMRDRAPLGAAILAGAAAYPIMLAATGAVNGADVRTLFSLLQRKKTNAL